MHLQSTIREVYMGIRLALTKPDIKEIEWNTYYDSKHKVSKQPNSAFRRL